MTDRMEIAKAVREAFEKGPRCLSDNALAEETGVPQSVVWRIKAGQRPARPEVLEKLADGLARWAEECEAAETALREIVREQGGQHE